MSQHCRSRSGAESGALLRDLIIDSGEEQGVFGIKFYVNGMAHGGHHDRIPCTEISSSSMPGHENSVMVAVYPMALLFLKAWAKLRGSYEATAGGYTDDALNYLTGGLCSTITLTRDPTGGRSPRSPRSPGRSRTGDVTLGNTSRCYHKH